MKAWAVINPRGEIRLNTFALTKKESTYKWGRSFGSDLFHDWKYWKNKGYTCKRIIITKE